MSTTLLVLAVASAAWLVYRRSATPPQLDIPHIGFDGDESPARYSRALTYGYQKYLKNGLPFSLPNPNDPKRPMIILPFKYLQEVKYVPEERLSFWRHIDQQSILSHLGVSGINHEISRAARIGLNRGLPHLIQPLQDASHVAFAQEMPPCPDWKQIEPYQLILKIFASMSACVMVGPELGDVNGPWQKLSMGFVATAMTAPGKVQATYPPYLYWLSQYLNDGVKAMRNYRRRAGEILKPALDSRIVTVESKRQKRTGPREYEDAVQWLLDEYTSSGKDLDAETLAGDLFVIMTASIHSTSSTGLGILFDMMEHSEAVEEIREEIARVGGAKQNWTRQTLSQLRLLDSFMRESARVHALTQYTAAQRIPVSTPFTFRDGLTIPPNFTFAFASYHHGLDSDVHADPSVFDPKRHLRKREGRNVNKYHFASASEDMINWGAGRHACPGRFFAQETLKLMFIHLVTHYEFKHTDEGTKSPHFASANLFLSPNRTLPVMVRERKT